MKRLKFILSRFIKYIQNHKLLLLLIILLILLIAIGLYIIYQERILYRCGKGNYHTIKSFSSSVLLGSKLIGAYPDPRGDYVNIGLLIIDKNTCEGRNIDTGLIWDDRVMVDKRTFKDDYPTGAFTIYRDQKYGNSYTTQWFLYDINGTLLSNNIDKNEKLRKVALFSYSNPKLGFEILPVDLKTSANPVETDFGNIKYLNFESFDMSIGKLYDRDGNLLDYLHLRQAFQTSYPSNIESLNVQKYPATIITPLNSTINTQAQPYLIIQDNDRVFVISASNSQTLHLLVTALNITGIETTRLLFPQPQSTTATSLPTIIGKIRQSDEVFLASELKMEPVPYNYHPDEKRNYLKFISGKVINLKVSLDGIQQSKIFGFPQYPTISCDSSHTGNNNLRPFQGILYGQSDDLEIIDSKEECSKLKADRLPPVIFIFKPSSNLSSGKHTVHIETQKGTKSDYDFYVNSDFTTPDLDLDNIPSSASSQLDWDVLDAPDNCISGYYYDKSYLHLPLPTIDNPELTYQFYFPQSTEEISNINDDRKVKMVFDGTVFDLRLPQSNLFYFSDELPENYPRPDSWNTIFIPRKHLYFTNGIKADTYTPQDSYDGEYMQLVPFDNMNRTYLNKSIYWDTSRSSSCDG